MECVEALVILVCFFVGAPCHLARMAMVRDCGQLLLASDVRWLPVNVPYFLND